MPPRPLRMPAQAATAVSGPAPPRRPADLAESDNTTMDGTDSFGPPSGRQTKAWHGGPRAGAAFGIREHAMAAALNGISPPSLTRAYEPGRSAAGSNATSYAVSSSPSASIRFDALRWYQVRAEGTRRSGGWGSSQKSPAP